MLILACDEFAVDDHTETPRFHVDKVDARLLHNRLREVGDEVLAVQLLGLAIFLARETRRAPACNSIGVVGERNRAVTDCADHLACRPEVLENPLNLRVRI